MTTKSKFEVIIPWNGVEKGDIIELDAAKINPAWKANLREVGKKTKLTPATPAAQSGQGTKETKEKELTDEERRDIVVARLKELEIGHHPQLGLPKLLDLLPEGEEEKLFASETPQE